MHSDLRYNDRSRDLPVLRRVLSHMDRLDQRLRHVQASHWPGVGLLDIACLRATWRAMTELRMTVAALLELGSMRALGY